MRRSRLNSQRRSIHRQLRRHRHLWTANDESRTRERTRPPRAGQSRIGATRSNRRYIQSVRGHALDAPGGQAFDVLSWLLNPRETHGLGSYCLRTFLKRVAHYSAASPKTPSVIEIDSWNLDGAVITAEWHGIDILVQDDANRFVAVFENKIDSGEHSDQLRRYRADVEAHFHSTRSCSRTLPLRATRPRTKATSRSVRRNRPVHPGHAESTRRTGWARRPVISGTVRRDGEETHCGGF